MSLSDVCIRRPVLAIVMSVIIVIFGAVGFHYLGVREYPAVDPPIVTVQTTYPGANPDVVAAQITEPLEQVINGISGIRTLSSESREERSTITVEFTLDSDLDAATNDVRDRVSRGARNLPIDANPPVVEKADADSMPILFLSMESEKRGILEVSNFADRVVRERMETIPGVSSIRIFGEKRYSMRLWMDPIKMAVHEITPLDVQDALTKQNVDLPSGRIEGAKNELTLRTLGRLKTQQDFEGLIIKQVKGRQILFRDIGYAELGPEVLRTGFKGKGNYKIGVAIIPQPNTNAIAIADEFYRRMEQVKKELPADIKVEIGYDFTRFVRNSVSEVKETLIIAFALVALIIFGFLRDWRSTIIPVIAIPVSIIAGFFIMYVAGFSINVLTLVAIVLSIGLVCDDAIVVLENIYAKIEAGLSPLEAALQGSREIYFAVISTTLALVVVFTPLVFLSGLTGRLFREFGITIAGCVLVSAFVALTLSPMMCRFLLKRHGDQPHWLYRRTEPFFRMITAGYRGMLALARRADPAGQRLVDLANGIDPAARVGAFGGSGKHSRECHRARGVDDGIHRKLDGQDRCLRWRSGAGNLPQLQHSWRRHGAHRCQCGGPEHLSHGSGRPQTQPGADCRASHQGHGGFYRSARLSHATTNHRRPSRRPTSRLCVAGTKSRSDAQGAARVSRCRQPEPEASPNRRRSQSQPA